jgi:hypothetical protein
VSYTSAATLRRQTVFKHGRMVCSQKRIERSWADAQLDGRKEKVCGLLAQGLTPDTVARTAKLHIQVVRRIRDENPECVAHLKNQVARDLGETVQIMSKRLVEYASTMPADKIPTAISQIIDRYQLLSGGVTVRTEHRNVATPEDLEAMFAALPSAKVIDTTTVELTNGDGHD